MLLRAASVLTLLLASHAQAGTILKTINRNLANDREQLSTSYAQQGKLRVETGNSKGTVLIFKDEVLYSVDTEHKTYTMLDRATLQRMVEQLGPALKRMQDMLAMVPPEQREQLAKKFGVSSADGGKPVVEKVRKTGRNDKIAGYTCSIAEVLRDDVVSTEACVATPAALKGSQELLDSAAQLTTFLKQFTDQLDTPYLRQMIDGKIDNYTQLGGIPVHTRRFDAGKVVFESTLQSISTATLPTTLFEIPDGFTKKDVPLAH